MDRCRGGGGGGDDPYEERLLAVFESCDIEGRGLLDGEGLSRLCRMLELEDRRAELLSRLQTQSPPLVNVTFPKFREALLALLAAAPVPSDDRQPSPVREVSPKFVYGQKKYGRRSRPESSDHDDDCHDITIEEADTQNDTFVVEIKNNHCNGDMSPDSEIIGSDRSVADDIRGLQYTSALNNGNERISDKDAEVETGSGEVELREAWCRLGLGSDGYLHRNELAMVCSAVGMDTLADQVVAQVFSKLNTDQDGRISFEEFLELFRSRAGSPPSLSRSPPIPFQQPSSPDGFGKSPSVSSDLWENGGGSGRIIQELQSVRSLLESVTEERDKLKSDLADANYRAAVLAQEVDEHHARIETATQNKVKLLEQKHTDEVKEIKRQAACDREQLAAVNQKLELEVSEHVDQLSRVTSQLSTLHKEYEALEKENRLLSERLRESEMSSESLHKQLECMEAMHQRVLELETAEECSSGLQERLASLQVENTELRDRNDELTTQLELLQSVNNRQLQRRENSWEGSNSSSGGGSGGGGTKRRGGKSPPGGIGNCNGGGDWSIGLDADASRHRLGKVRRCCTDNNLSNHKPLVSTGCLSRQQNSESGLESDFDTIGGSSPTPSNSSLENGSCSGSTEQEIEHLRAYVSQLESKLDQFQMMKEWELSKVNCNASDDDCSLQYVTTPTVKSHSTQATNTSIGYVSDGTGQKSLEEDQLNGRTTLEINFEQESDNKETVIKFGTDSLINRILEMSSEYDTCQLESCQTFRHFVKESIREIQSYNTIKKDILKDNYAPYPLDSIEDYQLSEDSGGSGNNDEKTITKFDELSQFAFEFVDNDKLKAGEVANNRSEENKDKDGVNGELMDCSESIPAEEEEDEEELQRLKRENIELTQRCLDLETSLEMMRIEYEKTEDYWANKLDEERKHFELDQQQSDEKFAELETKIQEYAEMLSNEQGRKQQLLPPIEERDFLEKQFTDLEEEYESYRQAVEMELAQKDCDISNLEQALAATALIRAHNSITSLGDCKNAQVQTEVLDEMEFQSPSSAQSVDQVDSSDKKSSGGCWCSCHEEERKEFRKTRELRTRLKSDCESLLHHKKNLLYQLAALRASTQITCRETELVEALSFKLREQEAKCRQLETALRHHQRHTQRLINKEWESHKSNLMVAEGTLKLTGEKLAKQTVFTKQLWEKLSAAEVLVKNLYVKNSQLELELVKLQHQHHQNNNTIYEQHAASMLLVSTGVDNKHQYNSL